MADPEPFGLLIVDKPVGPTSHDVVQEVRRTLDMRRVGHTGTLDPRASGVLVLCLGKATRLSEYLTGEDKRYQAAVEFGRSTTTFDDEGEVVEESGRAPTREQLKRELRSFVGTIRQRPPAYSAIRVEGQRAYALSRRGEPPDLESREVTIHELKLQGYEPPLLQLEIYCSAGTYIRSLAHDLGQAVGTGAYLAGLRRTRVGPFGLGQAVPLQALEAADRSSDWRRWVVPAAQALPEWPRVQVEGEYLERLRHGRRIPAENGAGRLGRAVGPDGRLVAVVKPVDEGRAWQPHKVFIS